MAAIGGYSVPAQHVRPAGVHLLLGQVPQGILGGEAEDRRRPLSARAQERRELVPALPACTSSRAVDSTQAEAVGALWVFRYHRKLQGATQLSPPSLRRVAQVVEPPLATGTDSVGEDEPVAGALSAPAAAHPFFHRHVAKPWTEEPDAVVPHVRIRGSLGGAIPRGDPTTDLSGTLNNERDQPLVKPLSYWHNRTRIGQDFLP
jgi:hypothetical protein